VNKVNEIELRLFFHRSASGENTMGRLLRKVLLSILSATFLGGFAAAQKQAPHAATNVLLVHGAFADSDSWNKVIPILKANGLHVVTVDIPLTSLAEDVAVTKKAISQQTGPVLLVAHSYGGTVITEAGDDPKVAGLVYIAAYAPNKGQTTGELGLAFPKTPGRAEIQPQPGGLLLLSEKGVSEDFAEDLPASEQSTVFASQIPLAAASFQVKLSTAAWNTKPSWYIVATNDRIINPDLERSLAKRMDAKTTEIPSSHVVMLSHPEETAAAIIQAAGK
jgi:pimeloyl-ACP methyl ester carboxylesterase